MIYYLRNIKQLKSLTQMKNKKLTGAELEAREKQVVTFNDDDSSFIDKMGFIN